MLWELDEDAQGTGRIAGLEIALLAFDRWDDLPHQPVLWRLPGWSPLPLAELLQRKQKEVRQQAVATVKDR